MKRIIVVFTIMLLLFNCNKDDGLQKSTELVQVAKIAELPSVLQESSGIEIAATGGFWSFNDSNGEAELYRIDESGALLQTVKVENADNKDWEDITIDDEGNLYIGDFGNNDNDRNNLRIYKINSGDLGQNDDSVAAQKIKFAFPDQNEFPPPPAERFFDVESLFAKGNNLFLLTRDRSLPFAGKTRLYKIPNTPGDYIAEYVDEFVTDKDQKKGQITAADISADFSRLVMISNESVWLFQNISGEDFFTGELIHCDFSRSSDLEGIVFQEENTLFLTSEGKPDEAAQLFRMTIEQ